MLDLHQFMSTTQPIPLFLTSANTNTMDLNLLSISVLTEHRTGWTVVVPGTSILYIEKN